jgi:hypothetical protein
LLTVLLVCFRRIRNSECCHYPEVQKIRRRTTPTIAGRLAH